MGSCGACCHNQREDDYHQDKPRRRKNIAEMPPLSETMLGTQGMLPEHQIVFKAKMTIDPLFMSFSQRRFIGFRKRFEFDKRRILICDGVNIAVLGYDHINECPFELICERVVDNEDNEKIVFASFIEDISPENILIVIENKSEQATYFKIAKIIKKTHILSYSFSEDDHK